MNKSLCAKLGLTLTLAGSPAAACVVGPVAFDSPACELKTVQGDEHRDIYVQWSDENGVGHQISVIAPKRRWKFSSYLERWRHSHKCAANKIDFGAPTHFDGAGGAAVPSRIAPPQITWTGSCAGGDLYIARAISVGDQIVEAQVYKRRSSSTPLEERFAGLLGQIKLSAPAKPDAESRRSRRLPKPR